MSMFFRITFLVNMQTILNISHLATKVCQGLDPGQIQALYDVYSLDKMPTALIIIEEFNMDDYLIECCFPILLEKLKSVNTGCILHIGIKSDTIYILPNGDCLLYRRFEKKGNINTKNSKLFTRCIKQYFFHTDYTSILKGFIKATPIYITKENTSLYDLVNTSLYDLVNTYYTKK